jgi:hypothetical protein
MKTKQILKFLSGMVLTGFGGMSLFMTLSVIFDWFGIREKKATTYSLLYMRTLFAEFCISVLRIHSSKIQKLPVF